MPRPFKTVRYRWTHDPSPRLQHPSWGRTGESVERIAVSAADFWNRLGL